MLSRPLALYVSNVYTITVYSYPQGKLVATLRNFDKPYGECVDKTGKRPRCRQHVYNKATLEGSMPLTGAGSVGQFGIAGSTVVTPNQFFSGSGVLYCPYPGGGASTKTITKGVFYPCSSVISPNSSR